MKSEAETTIPTLLEWLDAELEYHGMMMDATRDARSPACRADFTEHNIAHLHLTRLRTMAVERSVLTPTGVTSDGHRP